MIANIIESEESLFVQGDVITYKLFRSKKRRSSISMKLGHDDCLRINVPFYIKIEVVEDFIVAKYSWLLKKRQERSPRKKVPLLVYQDGEKYLYQGIEYPLRLISTNYSKVELKNGFIYIFHRKNSSIKNLLSTWYRQEALEYFNKRTALFASAHNLPAIKMIKVRYMKARWGSCSSDAVITYNVHLLKASPESIDYVILHELCHLIHQNHSSRFYQLQSKLNPGWKLQKQLLNEFGLDALQF